MSKLAIILAVIFLANVTNVFSQDFYRGTMEGKVIEIVIDDQDYLEELVGFYELEDVLFNNYSINEPIDLSGYIEDGRVVLFEIDRKSTDTLKKIVLLNVFGEDINGYFFDEQKDIQKKITLKKVAAIGSYQDEVSYESLEYIQYHSLDDFYFKLVYKKPKGDEPFIYEVNVYRKKDNSLFQNITGFDEGGWFIANDLLEIGDVNFDGFLDFYFVFSNAGTNSSLHFFAFNPQSNLFEQIKPLSEIVNPEFDKETRIIKSKQFAHYGALIQTYRFISNDSIPLLETCEFTNHLPPDEGAPEYAEFEKAMKELSERASNLIGNTEISFFKKGEPIPFDLIFEDYFYKRTKYFYEDSKMIKKVAYVTDFGEEGFELYPQKTGVGVYNGPIEEIIVKSPYYKTKEGIGINCSIEKFINTFSEYKIYALNGDIVLETSQYPDIEFILSQSCLINDQLISEDYKTLKKEDIKPNARIFLIRI